MKLLHGEKVEVWRTDEGLDGSWHTGRVIDIGIRSRIVQYDHLLSNDNCSKLKETISVSAAIDGQIENTPEDHRGHIRPCPPRYELHESEVRYGLCVDALVADEWHEGVVFDRADSSKQRLVFFPDQDNQRMIGVERLRLACDWNEVSGEWKPHGEWLLLRAIQSFEQEDGLPVSVRQIWYDLRTTAEFSDKIGVWTHGSYDTWHGLLSDLIKELRAVTGSSLAADRLLSVPTSSAAANVLVEDFLCSSVVAVAENPVADFLCMDGLDSAAMEDNVLCSKAGTLDDRLFHDILLQGNSAKASSLDIGSNELDEVNAKLIRNNDNAEDNNVTKSRDLKGWIPLDLGAAYDPESIQLCVHHSEARRNWPKKLEESEDMIPSVRLKAKKHLLAVGWKIETRIRWVKNEPRLRTRFVSPEGRSYGSLHTACCGLLKEYDEKNPKCRNQANVQKNFETENFVTASEDGNLSRTDTGKCSYLAEPFDIGIEEEVLANVLKEQWHASTNHLMLEKENLATNVSEMELPAYAHGLLASNQLLDVPMSSDTAGVLTEDFPWMDGLDLSNIDLGAIEDNYHRSSVVMRDDLSFFDILLQGNNVTASSLDTHADEGIAVASEIGVHREEELSLSGSNEVNTNLIWTNDNAEDNKATKSRDSKGWIPLDIEAEYDPESIQFCVDHSEDGTHGTHGTNELISKVRLKAKKHLLALGWKIESRTRWKGNVSRVRTRFVSSEGRLYQSLHTACCGLLKEISRKVCSKTLKKENLESNIQKTASHMSYSSEIGKQRLVHLKEHRSSKKRKMASHMSSPSSEKSSRVVRPSKRSKYPMAEAPGHHVPRTVLSLLIDEDMVLPRQKVRYVRRKDGHVLKEGRITRDGIKCKCCKLVYTLSNFGAHADSIRHRSSTANIFLLDGRSLLDCQMRIMHCKKPRDFQRSRVKGDYSAYESDIICSFCHDGGSLVLCDYCPSAYHLSCVGLKDVPEGEWFCPSCRCGVCGQSEFNSDTRQLTEKTVVYCDQCEREFHVECMGERVRTKLSHCPIGNWFCSRNCSKIFLHLRKLLGKSRPTAIEGLSFTVLRSGSESGIDKQPFDAETVAEHESKLCVALNVLHECFMTITEPRTQSDFVADLLFNKESELRRLNFYGFYTMILERGDEIISVATFRVYGEKVAEMPLIGTRFKYRKQGMCRLLVSELEKLLLALGVERLLLPAVPQVLETWITSFGFSKMSLSDRLDLQEYTLLNFEDTTMCQKLLGKARTVSEAVKTMEPIRSSIGVDACDLPDVDDQPVSNYVDPTEETLAETGVNSQSQLNTYPGNSCNNNVLLEISPSVMVKSSASYNFKFFRRRFKRCGPDRNLFESATGKRANTCTGAGY